MTSPYTTNDLKPFDPLRHGAYVWVRFAPDARPAASHIAVGALTERLRFINEFGARGEHPDEAFAFLKRIGARAGNRADDRLGQADAVLHVGSQSAGRVTELCEEFARLLGSAAELHVQRGVVRPMRYTANEMYNFAYGRRVVQQPGSVMPNAFILPLSKTKEWWAKDWMERHTYFLPKHDAAGSRVCDGHALAAASGIEHLLRRTYVHPSTPAPRGEYDFLTYFECSDTAVPVFHDVCAALRDPERNPEWAFVREGPTWHGRRIETWNEVAA